MVSPETRQKYMPTIGIECHVQLKTKTKLFSAVGNDAREASPNTLISHIDLGMPGALPVLNEKAVELAMRMAYAFGTEPQDYSYFERKHYFYPDLPKGYQITQLSHPIVIGGQVEIEVDGQTKVVRLNRVQMEEDAGKSTHPLGKDYSLVDLNRAGTPLLEIVSEPDINSAADAKAYARELYLLVRFADVSDADLYHGNMRFDVNVSVSKQPGKLGIRTETKNLNSFRSVEKTVEYEINRQIELLERNEKVIQETRGWDDAKQKTFSQRTKEEAHDYRYFPEPDIPPLDLTAPDMKAKVAAVKSAMPVLPNEWRERLKSLGLDKKQVDILLEAEVEHEDVNYLPFIAEALDDPLKARQQALLMINVEIPEMRREGKAVVPQSAKWALIYKPVIELIEQNKINSTTAKVLLQELLYLQTLPSNIETYAQQKGYLQVSDTGEIEKIVQQVLSDNPKAAEDVKSGEMKAIGFLVGQVMKLSQGKANPQMAQELIKKQLGV